MFVRMCELAVLPTAVPRPIQHSTAQQAGSRALFELYLSIYHILSELQEFQVLEALERFELKNISLMVQPHCQIS